MTNKKTTKLPFYTGLFYYLVRPMARIGIWMYYRKIYISHAERIPRNKPVIIAANHPTGFMEPCIMAVFMRRPLYFLVRGDFFRKSYFNFLMRSLNMIPIFRKRDGNFRDLKSNYASFAACYEALRANRTIMIFPEGSAVHEKRLRPLQKGISRLAFGAMQEDAELEDLFIVPLGVSYTYSERPRSEVMIRCGEPISVRSIIKKSGDSLPAFDKVLRSEVTAAMKENLVHINEDEDLGLIEQLQQIKRTTVDYQSVLPVRSDSDQLLQVDKSISEQINQASHEEKEQLLELSRPVFQSLFQWKVPLVQVIRHRTASFLSVILLAISAIPVWIGYTFCYPPASIAKRIADTKVTRTEFYSPVMVAAHIGYFLIYYIIWFMVSLFSGKWWIFFLSLVLGALGFSSLWWREHLQTYLWRKRVGQIAPNAMESLRKQCELVLERI